MGEPLSKPDHLKPGPNEPGEWMATHAAGAVALALGVIAFIVVAMTQERMWSTPDWRVSVPAFALTLVAAIVSLVRRERASSFWLVGLGCAGAALVLGWFLMLAIVIGATVILILILHSVM